MADQVSPQSRSTSRAGEEASGWAVGYIQFAAIMMVMAGIFHTLAGLVAIFDNTIYVATVATRNLFYLDVTAWGWAHLVVGVVMALAGWGLVSGPAWARVVGVIVAVLSAIANFLFIPHYPVWSLLVIALDVLVIWALVAHGRDIQAATTLTER